MEKLKTESSLEETTKLEAIPKTARSSLGLKKKYSRKIKPRALIFRAQDKDLHKIKELIETQFPEVEIIYVTTGPAASILHVTRSMPFETQDSSIQTLYPIE